MLAKNTQAFAGNPNTALWRRFGGIEFFNPPKAEKIEEITMDFVDPGGGVESIQDF